MKLDVNELYFCYKDFMDNILIKQDKEYEIFWCVYKDMDNKSFTINGVSFNGFDVMYFMDKLRNKGKDVGYDLIDINEMSIDEIKSDCTNMCLNWEEPSLLLSRWVEWL